MADATVSFVGTVSRDRPQAKPDNTESGPRRFGAYDEDYAISVIPTKHVLCDEGSYFVTTNPTPGSVIANDNKTAFSDTVPWLYLFNGNTAASRIRAYLDYIKIIVTTAPTTTTQAHFAVIADLVARFPTTNNTTALTPVSPNTGGPFSPKLTVNLQSSATASAVPASSGAKRVVARGAVGGQPIAGDELVITFGSPDVAALQGLTAAQATTPGRKITNCPPVILDPGHSAVVHVWFVGAGAAMSHEFEMGHWER